MGDWIQSRASFRLVATDWKVIERLFGDKKRVGFVPLLSPSTKKISFLWNHPLHNSCRVTLFMSDKTAHIKAHVFSKCHPLRIDSALKAILEDMNREMMTFHTMQGIEKHTCSVMINLPFIVNPTNLPEVWKEKEAEDSDDEEEKEKGTNLIFFKLHGYSSFITKDQRAVMIFGLDPNTDFDSLRIKTIESLLPFSA